MPQSSKALSQALELVTKLYAKQAANFIFSERLCEKHMKQMVKKNYKDRNKVAVKQILSICSKCGKGGICYYINE